MQDRERIARALPSYEVSDEIGRGAWGVVFRGRHRQLARAVAIKELPQAFAADPGVRQRFVSEGRLLANLDHPHIVPIYDYVEAEGLCLLVMELLPGGTVWGRFTTNGVSATAACSIAIATSSALHHAHGKGILHRDIKPENLLFTETGTLKVSDFGIAKMVGGSVSMGTRTGEVLGTPAYMAPEQALGNDLTAATDVYAIGTVLYELLSGCLPYAGDGNPVGVLYRHVHEAPLPITATSETPDVLADVVMRTLAREPDDRFATAEDLGVALADAAGAAWGPGWANGTGVNIMAPGRIGERISGPGAATSAPVVTAPATGSRPAPATVADAAGTERRRTAAPTSPSELVPIQEVVPTGSEPPPPPDVATPPTKRRRRRTALLGAGAAAVVAVVAVVVALLLTRGNGSSPSESSGRGSPAVAATISVGEGADHLAVGNGRVWVTTNAARGIVAVDPTTNGTSNVASLDQTPHGIAIDDSGVLWITPSGTTDLLRVEPGEDPSGSRTTPVPVGTQLAEVAVGEGSAWATSPQAGTLVRVDLATQRPVATIGAGPAPDSVAVGAGAVWVANRLDTGPGTVTRVDPSSNQVVATIAVGGRPDHLAVGAGAVWVVNATESTVSRIDPSTNAVVATINAGPGAQSVTVGEGAVWVSNTDVGTVSRVDPETNSVTATIPVGARPENSAAGEGGVWVVNLGDGTVSRIQSRG
jgi:YVTN family beta-propeller protein